MANVVPISISEETRRRYLNYALSVITSRALPDVRDGLKPVQRRILYAMRQEGYRADGRNRKCAGVIGEVTKSYHPHSPDAVYDALVRICQDWVLRYTLVHGEGNFGSVDGDPAAAMRYTECRLMPLAEELMAELDRDTVEMRPNFDGEKTEPVVLPARFPHLLCNGSQGIAVGMATNIPPHNLGELLRACLVLIDDRETTTANLVNLHRGPIKGPDFPLGGKMIIDQRALREIYENGQGTIRVQGEWRIELPGKNVKVPAGALKNRARNIVVHSIPYGVNKGQMLANIGAILEDRKLPMVEHLVDESSLDNGMRIVLELKEGANPDLVMAYLFKHTQLQENFACNFTSLFPAGDNAGGAEMEPRRTGIREMLIAFLDFRFETVRRRFEYELAQLRRRIHILEGFRIIFNALDEALKLIRASSGRADAAEKLRDRFGLDEVQSFAVVDLNLYKIGQLEIKKIMQELREKKEEAARIEDILASKRKLWKEVRGELEAFAAKYADKRRTSVADADESPEFDPEAYIVRENSNVVLSRDGWVKRVGRLSEAGTLVKPSELKTRVREGDEVVAVVPGSTLDYAMFFSSDGIAYTTRIDELPASSGYGEPLAKFFKLRDGATIVAAMTTDKRFAPDGVPMPPRRNMFFGDAKEWQLLVATRKGQVLRTPLAPFMVESTKVGRKFARLRGDDQVVFVAVPTADHETMFLAADDGRVIHFPIAEVAELAGVGSGVRGIKLVGKASCIGGYILSGFRECMRIENTGGTIMEFRRGKYIPTSRGGKGYEAIKRGGFRRILVDDIAIADFAKLGEPNGGASS